MKKIISLFLTFAMLFSLAMPAMAVEVTGSSNTDDPKNGTVSGTYNPTIKITDVVLSEMEGYDNLEIDEENKKYIVTIPEGESTAPLTVTIKGQNLNYITNGDRTYQYTVGTFISNLSSFLPNYYDAASDSIIVGGYNVGVSNFGAITYNNGAGDVATGWTIEVWSADSVSVTAMLKAVDSEGNEVSGLTGYLDGRYELKAAPEQYSNIAYGEAGYHYVTNWSGVPDGYKTPDAISLNVTDEDGDGFGELTSLSSHATVTTEMIEGKTVYVITVTLKEEVPVGDTKTIYFDNTKGWATVNAYAWDVGGSTFLGAWPGTAMTLVEGETTIYSIEVPTNASRIIFSYGSDQTSDLTIPTDDRNLYTYSTREWSVYGSTTEPAEITGVSINVDGTEYTSGNVTVTLNSNVTITVTGTNLQYATGDNYVLYASEVGDALTSGNFAINEGGTSATMDVPVFIYEDNNNFEIVYYNDYTTTQTAVSTGIYVTYDESAAPDTRTIYFDDTKGWGSVYAHAWNDNGSSLGNYPGAQMTKVEGEDSIYSVEVPTDAVGIFFHTGAGETTGELTIPTDDRNLYTYSTGEWSVYGSTGGEEPVTFPDPLYLNTLKAINRSYWNDDVSLCFYDSEGQYIDYVDGTKIAYGLYSFAGIPDGTAKVTFVCNMGGDSIVGLTPVAGCNMYVMDGGTDDSGSRTGSWSVYDPAVSTIAKITGITVTGGYSIENGAVTVVEGGAGITVTVTGENFAALTENHEVGVALYEGLTSANGWTIDTENNTAVKIFAPADLIDGVPVSYVNPGDTTGIESGYIISVLKPGTTLETIYFNTGGNSAWTNVVANFVDSSFFGLDRNSMTMKETNIYATQGEIPELAYYVSFNNGSEETGDIEIPTDGKNMYNLADGTWSLYTPSIPEDTTSAEITWGSMAFTYSDEQVTLSDGSTAEKGWSTANEAGAGTVTVKNTGETTFTAQVAYTAVDEYAEIEGEFDAASAELAAEASKTFTLTLKNKPNKAIPAGTKIGSVTITINEAAEG